MAYDPKTVHLQTLNVVHWVSFWPWSNSTSDSWDQFQKSLEAKPILLFVSLFKKSLELKFWCSALTLARKSPFAQNFPPALYEILQLISNGLFSIEK